MCITLQPVFFPIVVYQERYSARCFWFTQQYTIVYLSISFFPFIFCFISAITAILIFLFFNIWHNSSSFVFRRLTFQVANLNLFLILKSLSFFRCLGCLQLDLSGYFVLYSLTKIDQPLARSI